MIKFSAVAAVALLSAAVPALGQGVVISGPSGRDVAPATGRATIRGRVVAADTGRPLRDARVSIFAPELLTTRVVATDAQGRYELANLPAGDYTVTASKETFATIALGQTRPSGAAQTLALGETQTFENANFSLQRGGVIAGTVFDDADEPLIAATVTAMRATYPRGQRRLIPVATATTNDLGEYRIFRLPPGSFYVSAAKRFTLGTNFVPDSESTYPATLFPGTAHVADARPVVLKLGVPQVAIAQVSVNGENVTGVRLLPANMSTVAGKFVVDPRDASALAAASVGVGTSPAAPGYMSYYPGSSTVAQDLSFVLRTPPGRLLVRPTAPKGWVVKAVRLRGADVTDLGIDVPVSGDLDGVEVELTHHPPQLSGSARGSKGEPLSDYSVVILARDPARRASPRYFALARPDQNGTFSLSTLPPGDYFAAALEYVEADTAADPDFLKTLVTNAVPFVLNETEEKTLDLKVGP